MCPTRRIDQRNDCLGMATGNASKPPYAFFNRIDSRFWLFSGWLGKAKWVNKK
jgi:hypothetical protein